MAVGLIGYLAISAIAAEKFTYALRLVTRHTPKDSGMLYEEVIIPAREDGVKIAGWYIPTVERQTSEKPPAIIMVHGWNSSRTVCCNKHFLDLAQALHKSGYSVLMIDLRGHGRSAKAHFSFGIYERRDVLAAIDFLLSRGYQPGQIGLLGISMGAAAVLGAAIENQAVGAVVAESLFVDIYPVIKGLWVHHTGLPMIFILPVRWMFRLKHGYDVASARPIDEIHKLAPRPLLLIQCTADSVIPVEHFRLLRQAAPWAETWLVEGCRHADIYEYVPHEYSQRLIAFFKASLQKK